MQRGRPNEDIFFPDETVKHSRSKTKYVLYSTLLVGLSRED